LKSTTAIICTYNRANLLKTAIHSVIQQSASPDEYEILVIDSASTDNTKNVVQDIQRDFPAVKYVYEQQLGLSHARNRGIKEADTEIVAFLDDDARAEKNWVTEIQNSFEKIEKLSALGGPVYLEWEGSKKPSWLAKHLEYALSYQYYGDAKVHVNHLNGCNMAFFKKALEQYGGFNTEIGRIGDQMLAGEESHLYVRMRKDQKVIIYNPQMTVYHFVPLYKQKISYFIKVYKGYGKSASIMYGEFRFKTFVKQIYLLFTGSFNVLKYYRRENFVSLSVIAICEVAKLNGFLFDQIRLWHLKMFRKIQRRSL